MSRRFIQWGKKYTNMRIGKLGDWFPLGIRTKGGPQLPDIAGLLAHYRGHDAGLGTINTWPAFFGNDLQAIAPAGGYDNVINGYAAPYFNATAYYDAAGALGTIGTVFSVAMCDEEAFTQFRVICNNIDAVPSSPATIGISSNNAGNTYYQNPGTANPRVNGVDTNIVPGAISAFHQFNQDMVGVSWGAGIRVGRDKQNPLGAWLGYIAEIIIYDHALTLSEKESVEAYLKNKYALP